MGGSGGVLWKDRDSGDHGNAPAAVNRPGKFIVGKLCDRVHGLQGLMALAGGGRGSENGGPTPIRLIGAR